MIVYLEVILLIVGLPIIWLIVIYNLLVRDKNRVLAAWSDIDVQLKRRHDVIPKLVDAVKQYADYETATLEAVMQLRTESQRLQNVKEKSGIEKNIGMALFNILAIAEDYPELKANDSFLDLQRELTEVENTIQYARRYYNGAVRNLNIRIDSFPDMIIARFFKFEKAEFFDFEETKQEAQ